MRLDWEGYVKGFWVYADYHWVIGTPGIQRIVAIEQLVVFDEDGHSVELSDTRYPSEEAVAEVIMQEIKDAA